MINRTYTAIAALLVAVTAPKAGAQTYYIPTYEVTNNAPNNISDILMFWEAPSNGYGPGVLWDTNVGGFEAAGDGATTPLSDLGKPVYPSGLLMLGLYDDAEGEHLTLLMNPTTADAVEGITFSDVFLDTDEDQLVNDIITIETDPNSDDWNQPLDDLFGFVSGAASNIPDNNGGTMTAWLTPEPSGIPTPGKIEIWSTGTEIGSFTASVQTQGSSAPGPAAIAPFAMSAMGFLRRRSKGNRARS